MGWRYSEKSQILSRYLDPTDLTLYGQQLKPWNIKSYNLLLNIIGNLFSESRSIGLVLSFLLEREICESPERTRLNVFFYSICLIHSATSLFTCVSENSFSSAAFNPQTNAGMTRKQKLLAHNATSLSHQSLYLSTVVLLLHFILNV